MDEALAPMEHLTVSQSWALVRSMPIGRLAVVVDGKPEIFPVNHVVDHGTVVFRTAEGTKLMGTLGKEVAYEVDGVESGGAVAWSVVIKGEAHEVARLHEAIESFDLPLFPWHRGPKPRIIRIEPSEVHGRRFTVTLTRDQTHVPHAQDE
jgi:nitroimidazol reductase NimA-like FMN-containing flavoprotein (pyridoxamine 5'-phosphate oxidase superfamily)